MVVAAGLGGAGPHVSVRLVGKAPRLEAGATWAALVRARGEGPRLLARLDRRVLPFATVRAGRDLYRARVRLPTPGRWLLSARLAGRRFELAHVLVSPASYRLANPGQLLVMPDGQILLAERGARDQILRIDPATGRFGTFVRGLPEPFGIARAPDGAILVSSAAGIYRLEPSGGEASRVFAIDAGPIAPAANGDVFYANQLELRMHFRPRYSVYVGSPSCQDQRSDSKGSACSVGLVLNELLRVTGPSPVRRRREQVC